MLLVRACRGPSAIHSLGLIAQEAIPQGTLIWRFQPGFDVIITEPEFTRLSPEARRQVLLYATFDSVDRVFVLGSDDDRFTNHSENPNMGWLGDDLAALRDISQGEEITCNYRDFGWTEFKGGPPGSAPRMPGDA